MSIDALKRELSALSAEDQRRMTAFLVSLQDLHDDAHAKKLAAKIDQPASKFATLEELDRRLQSSEKNGGQ